MKIEKNVAETGCRIHCENGWELSVLWAPRETGCYTSNSAEDAEKLNELISLLAKLDFEVAVFDHSGLFRTNDISKKLHDDVEGWCKIGKVLHYIEVVSKKKGVKKC